MGDSEKFERYHDKGEQDYSKGKYNKPYGGLHDTLGMNSEKQREINKAYSKGWNNAKKQEKK